MRVMQNNWSIKIRTSTEQYIETSICHTLIKLLKT